MEARQLSPEWVVGEVTDRPAFMALQPGWDELIAATARSVFHRHEFLRVWLDNFAPGKRWRILVARDPHGVLQAVLPLVQETVSFYGMPVAQLGAAANPHSCRFDLVARSPEEAARLFWAHLSQDRGWDVLRLTDVPDGGAAWALVATARAEGNPTGTWESLRSPYICLPESWEALQERLSAKFRGNLRRRRKRLEEKGKVTFERVEGGPGMPAALEEGFALERAGWKGQSGTAMAQDQQTRGFYAELARSAAYRGELALYFLRLDGRPVAFQYGLWADQTCYLLKPAYDEGLKECSPGQLLMEEVLQDCLRRGAREFDFLGPDMIWKRDWTDRVRVHTWLYVFRPTTFGQALRRAKFDWIPKAKEVLERWKH